MLDSYFAMYNVLYANIFLFPLALIGWKDQGYYFSDADQYFWDSAAIIGPVVWILFGGASFINPTFMAFIWFPYFLAALFGLLSSLEVIMSFSTSTDPVLEVGPAVFYTLF